MLVNDENSGRAGVAWLFRRNWDGLVLYASMCINDSQCPLLSQNKKHWSEGFSQVRCGESLRRFSRAMRDWAHVKHQYHQTDTQYYTVYRVDFCASPLPYGFCESSSQVKLGAFWTHPEVVVINPQKNQKMPAESSCSTQQPREPQ